VKTAGLTTIVAALLIAVWIASPALAADCDANGIEDEVELGHVNLPADAPDNPAGLRVETAAGFGLTEFTVELWFRNSGSGQRSLFSYNGQFSDNELTILDVNGLDIAVGGVFSFSTFDAEATGNVGDWNHLSIAWRSSDGFTSIRVNGVEVATRTINPGDSVAAGGRLYLGQEQDAGAVDPDPLLDPNQAFFGDLRQVRVWNIFRSTGAVAADYTLPLTGTEPGLVSYWPLDDGAGTIATDLAGANDLDLIAPADWVDNDANNDGLLDTCTIINTTQVTAHPTIQDALDNAVAGDTIEVGPGTYVGTIDFLGKAVTLRSASGDPADTIIDGAGAFYVVQCVSGEGPDTVLEGFTITGGNADGSSPNNGGGGMRIVNASPTITDCVFSGNSADLGGGMFIDNASPTITDCVFSGNSAGLGGGMFIDNAQSSPTITDCVFSGNSAGLGGGIFNALNSSSTITNCVFSGNSASSDGGGGMFNDQLTSPTITNCVFSGNSADRGAGGGMLNNRVSPTITNCVFSGNTASNDGLVLRGGGGMFNLDGGNPVVANTILWDNTPEQVFNDAAFPSFASCNIDGGVGSISGAIDLGGNIDADPLFVDPDGPDDILGTPDDDLRLQGSSPCIDAGRDSLLPTLGGSFAVNTDLDGHPRCFDSLFTPSPEQVFSLVSGVAIPDNTPGGIIPGITITGGPASIDRVELDLAVTHPDVGELTVRLRNPPAAGGVFVTVFDQACPADADIDASFGDGFPGACASPLVGNQFSRNPLGAFADLPADGVWGVEVSDNAAGNTGTIDEFAIIFKPSIVDMGPYENRDLAFLEVPTDVATIQGAIDLIADDPASIIEVQPGTYVESIDFLGKAVTLRSASGDPADTIIDGAGAFNVVRCVSGEGPDTVLEGFTITGGNANGSFPNDGGGGMYNDGSSPTITNCVFSGNSAQFGGGMINLSSSPTITNCSFSGNSADDFGGGGMYNEFDSSPTIADCTFSGNTADHGGGMYNEFGSSPTITNCTFSGNSADGDGGGMYNDDSSSPTIADCTFSENTSFSGGGMYNEFDSSPTITNCVFSGNSAFLSGGGMSNVRSSPTVANCVFSGNSAEFGGGMSNEFDSSPTITDCTFSGNSADGDGGGMYNDRGSLTITNCTFSGNSANGEFGAGGGLFGSGTITNCTFSGNSASGEVGGGGLFGSGVVTNTVLWDNTPDQVRFAWEFAYCNIQGGVGSIPGATDLGGNIDADPLFVDPDGADDILGTPDDDLRLQPGSPCIDAGDNTAPALAGPPPITTDLGGAPRFFDDTGVPDTGVGPAPIIDMGAHEFQGVSPPPCPCVGDIDGDCDTDVFDFSALAANFGSGPGASRAQGDLTGDGFVDVFDFSELAADFGCAP
jgi:parallel beta-helix repeat protein